MFVYRRYGLLKNTLQRTLNMNVIANFSGEYRFLSNMFPCEVTFEGFTYPCSESAFQAAKCLDVTERMKFTSLTGFEAKKKGKKVRLRKDWENVKVDVMYKVLKSKFSDPILRKKLLDTKDAELVEGNHWFDTFWGVDMYSGVGKNVLGNLLMKVRSELSE